MSPFVEKQRSTVRVAKGPATFHDRAGEGAACVTEQLALEQFRGDRRAVHCNKRAGAMRPMPMDGAGNELLPGSRFAGDEHRGVTIGDEADRLLYRAHRGARSNQVVAIGGRRRRCYGVARSSRAQHP